MYLIGSGPTELHAHIDLHHRHREADHRATLAVLSTAHDAGHWSVVAEIQTDPIEAGEGQ
jgi:hypothetical protein